MTILAISAALVLAVGLAFAGRAWWAWVSATALLLADWIAHGGRWGALIAVVVWLALAIVTGAPAVRRRLITRPAMRRIGPLLPRMSDTERIALEAGTTWWDAELFSGSPDRDRIVRFTPQPLSVRERDFLAGGARPRPRRDRST